jgi:hypothetical protein
MGNWEYLVWTGALYNPQNTSPYADEGYPSNSDSITPFLFESATAGDTKDRFWPEDAASATPSVTPAPRGYFIIDALDRGPSRDLEYANLRLRYPQLELPISPLPEDSTVGGPTTVESFAGRVFYAGFPGGVVAGDTRSPTLSSYVLFSTVIKGSSDIGNCYQIGDPTSKDEADLVDTDGGFIKLDGAYGIQRIVTLGVSLVVLASNGVWSITGGGDFGFTASNYLVNKISDHSVIGPDSIAVVDGSLFFWGIDGIYLVTANEFGALSIQNLSKNTIQTFYNNISDGDKLNCKAFYDSYDNKVRWLYGDVISEGSSNKELIFDTELTAFYTSTINSIEAGYPSAVSILEVEPYKLSLVTENVTNNGELVTYNGDQVTYTSARRRDATRESMYVAITQGNPVKFTLSNYNSSGFKDWESYDDVGVDSRAFLITGYVSGGDFQRNKQANYLTMHFSRTENGMEEVDGDLVPAGQSSCLVRTHWDWANSVNSNRWGREFQAYRYKRAYMPENSSDEFDTGFETVYTKNRLRGGGKVLSLSISTEPGKDCHILGWSFLLGVNGNV